MVIWIHGRSGAGKTTLARAVCAAWRRTADNVVLVDGDRLRAVVGADREPGDYSLEGRRRNAERFHEVSRWLDGEGVHVVASILLIFDDVAQRNRAVFGDGYVEVHVDAPAAAVEARDPKGLYARARRGEEVDVVGVDLPYTPPSTPDLVVANHGPEPDWQAVAAEVLALAGQR